METTPSVKCRSLCEHWVPLQHPWKETAWWLVPASQCQGGRHWAAGPAELAKPQVSERPLSQKLKWRATKKDSQHHVHAHMWEINTLKDWRDISMVKTTGYSFRGWRIDFQHPHVSSKISNSSSMKSDVLFSRMLVSGTWCIVMHVGRTPIT